LRNCEIWVKGNGERGKGKGERGKGKGERGKGKGGKRERGENYLVEMYNHGNK
jgi:hypothetical protein